jgi:hypothetical protein
MYSLFVNYFSNQQKFKKQPTLQVIDRLSKTHLLATTQQCFAPRDFFSSKITANN